MSYANIPATLIMFGALVAKAQCSCRCVAALCSSCPVKGKNEELLKMLISDIDLRRGKL